MKKKFLFMFAGAIAMSSCKKTLEELTPISSLTVVNATTDVASAKVYASATPIFWRLLPAIDAAAQYRFVQQGVLAGDAYINAVSAADTTIRLHASVKAEELKSAASNTLFLFGQSGDYRSVMIYNDKIVNHTDSVMGIRFINLSPNSPSVNIAWTGSTTPTEVTNLAYGAITGFKNYNSLQTTSAMKFDIVDGSGSILASYTLPVTPVSPYLTTGIPAARFKNLTLVVKGLQGTTTGDNALGIFPVPHY